MAGTGIHHRCQTKLVNAVQALKKRMLYNVVQQSAGYLNESKYRIIDNLRLAHSGWFERVGCGMRFLKMDGLRGLDAGCAF